MWGRNAQINFEGQPDNAGIIYSTAKSNVEVDAEGIAEGLLIGKAFEEMRDRYGVEYMFHITSDEVSISEHEKQALVQWLLMSDLWDYEPVQASGKTISDYVNALFKKFLASTEYKDAQKANEIDKNRDSHFDAVSKFASNLRDKRSMQLRQVSRN